jgi:integrase
VPLRAIVVDARRDAGKIGPGVDPAALLFPAEDGGMLDLQSFRRNYWNEAVENAAIVGPHRTPYALQHTYAAHALAAGVNPHTLARRMGTSVEMIDETYGHLVADADGFERALLDAYDTRVSTSNTIEVETPAVLTPS